MLRLRGSQAYSDFRISKLLGSLQDRFQTVTAVYSQYQHLVKIDGDKNLSAPDLDKLEQLLTYGPKDSGSLDEIYNDREVFRVYVIPRIGTISPWASKATDIAHHCGLNDILRIERGVAFYISTSQPFDSSQVHEHSHFLRLTY